jgi:heme-degrading monooxygenase HmoA
MRGNPIELHVDLDVEPTKEKDLVSTFHTVFEPAISKQPGFVLVTLLKLRAAAVTYRLVISFETEEQRVAWVATADHQRVWPQMEKNLKGVKFTAALWDRL